MFGVKKQVNPTAPEIIENLLRLPSSLKEEPKKEQATKSITCSFYCLLLVGTRGFEPRAP